MPGVAVSGVEVTDLSANGFRVLLGEEELSVPFAQFPWFKKATVELIPDVQRPHGQPLVLAAA